MNIIEFFDDDVMALPIKRDHNILRELTLRYKKYFNHVAAITNDFATGVQSPIQSNIGNIKIASYHILDSLRHQLKGFPDKSAHSFDLAIAQISTNILQLISPNDVKKYLSFLYKIRLGKDCLYGKKDMFHIPFEKRHLVKTQRYSIPGLPCLYLAGSSYVCWEELGRPDLDEAQVVRLEAKSDIKILDFGWRSAIFAAMLDDIVNVSPRPIRPDERDYAINHAICWPIIAACSISVKTEQSSPFKIEYIIPQLLLRWIVKGSCCDGIRYFSTRINNYYEDPRLFTNYAFPVRNIKNVGLCQQLLSKFNMTEVVAWKYLKSLHGINYQPHHVSGRKIELIKNLPHPYQQSDWGKIDMTLSSTMTATQII